MIPSSRTRAVSWLAEVQTPPAVVPVEEGGRLAPLLVDSEGFAIGTLEQWGRRRLQLRAAWLEFLGPMPLEKRSSPLEILAEDRPEGCVRQWVRYEGEAGLWVEGYLLRPEGVEAGGSRPGLVALHPTTPETIAEIAGVTGRGERALGLLLAREGFVVFCPRCFLWQSVADYREALDRFCRRHPGTRGMRKMLWDASRAVDILTSLRDVDGQRVGAVGHSLGAKEVLYLAAFDERIRAAVASEGGIGFSFTNWDAPWYLGEAIHAPGFPLNHHQLLALIAPRAFLVLAGESGPGAADGDRTWPYLQAALPVYRLFGAPARLGLFNHRQGHTIPPEALKRLIEWLQVYL